MLLFSLFLPNGEEGLVQNPAASQHQNWESNPALLTPVPQASSARQECWSCLNNDIISARLVKAQKWVILFHHPLHEFQWVAADVSRWVEKLPTTQGIFIYRIWKSGYNLPVIGAWGRFILKLQFKKEKNLSDPLGQVCKYIADTAMWLFVACTHGHFKETLAIEVKHIDHMQTG